MLAVESIFDIDVLDLLFYVYQQFSSTKFFNQLTASDLLMPLTFLTVIISISLKLTHNIVKSWQLLQTESWNLNLWLKNQ